MNLQEPCPALPVGAEGEARRSRLVVVGNGMAGARTVEEILLRDGSRQWEIVVFGDEPCGNYNRVLLSGVLSGAQPAAEIFLHPLSWYAENGLTLYAGERVTHIDRANRTVTSAAGREVAYDRLILATGSRPFVPPVQGLCDDQGKPRAGVFVFRTLDDCRRIAGYAGRSRRAVVVGGGLLGLEAAYGLKQYGLEVHVVQQSGRLMDRQLDPAAAAILHQSVERMGVRVHLGRRTSEVLGSDRVRGVAFDDGTSIDGDMVVFACGIRPNVELARDCGLPVERGIVVDDHLRTADPAIFAVGECVEHRGTTYGLVAPAWEQARVLADHLTGRPESAYAGSRTTARLKVMGVELTSVGEPETSAPEDEVVQYVEPKRGLYKKLVIRDNRLVGAIILGDGERAPYVTQLFERGTPVPEDRAALFFDLGGKPGAVSPDEMAEDATVCHCNGVTKGDIRECVAGGGCSLSAVMRATRAGTGCGSCKGLVRVFVDRFRPKGTVEAPPPLGVEA